MGSLPYILMLNLIFGRVGCLVDSVYHNQFKPLF